MFNFSLDFSAFGPSDPGEPRDKVVLRGNGYAWAPILGEFRQTSEGKSFLLHDLIIV